jgi:hypothetical protein
MMTQQKKEDKGIVNQQTNKLSEAKWLVDKKQKPRRSIRKDVIQQILPIRHRDRFILNN